MEIIMMNFENYQRTMERDEISVDPLLEAHHKELYYRNFSNQLKIKKILIPANNTLDKIKFVCYQLPTENFTTTIRDDYEEIHRKSPGIFCDTVTLDNPNTAVKKMKKFLQNIVNSQKNLKPMFDIDFGNMKHYGIVKKTLENICKEIAPQRLFY